MRSVWMQERVRSGVQEDALADFMGSYPNGAQRLAPDTRLQDFSPEMPTLGASSSDLTAKHRGNVGHAAARHNPMEQSMTGAFLPLPPA